MQAYNGIKKIAKKAVAQDRVEKFKTGGGSFQSNTTPLDEQLLSIVGDRFHPLPNVFDSDSLFHGNC